MVNRTKELGSSLMELVCAFVVVSVIGVGLVHSGHDNAHTTAAAFHSTVAVTLAESEIERLRADRVAIVLGVTERRIPPASGLPEARLARRITTRSPGLAEVEVEVTWLEARTRTRRSVQLVGLVLMEDDR